MSGGVSELFREALLVVASTFESEAEAEQEMRSQYGDLVLRDVHGDLRIKLHGDGSVASSTLIVINGEWDVRYTLIGVDDRVGGGMRGFESHVAVASDDAESPVNGDLHEVMSRQSHEADDEYSTADYDDDHQYEVDDAFTNQDDVAEQVDAAQPVHAPVAAPEPVSRIRAWVDPDRGWKPWRPW